MAEATRLNILIDATVGQAVAKLHETSAAIREQGVAAKEAEAGTTRMAKSHTALKLGLGLSALAAVEFGKKSVEAFTEAQVVMGKAETMLDKNNKGWRNHREEIDKTLKKHMDLSGFDEHELFLSFANLARSTHSTTKALDQQQIAMDLARGRGVSLDRATLALVKTNNGSTLALKRFGIAVPKVTDAVDQLKATHDKYTAASLAAAKADDKRATAQGAIAAAARQFAGQSEKYSKSTAGQAELISAKFELLQVAIGQMLIPIIDHLQDAILALTSYFSDHKEVAKAVYVAFVALITIMGLAWAAVKVGHGVMNLVTVATKGWAAAQWLLNAAMDANPFVLIATLLVALGAALVLAWQHSETFREIVTAAWNAVKDVAEAVFGAILTAIHTVWDFLSDNWQTIAVVLSGPFAPIVALATNAFGVRDALIGAFQHVIDWVRQNWQAIATALSGPFAPVTALATNAFGIRTALINGLEAMVGGVKTAATAVWNAIKSALEAPLGLAGIFDDHIIQPIKNLVDDALRAGTSIAGHLADGVKNAAEIAISAMQSFFSDHIIQPIRNLLDEAFNAGRAMASHVADGIEQTAEKVWDGVKGAFAGFLNAIIDALNLLPFVDLHHVKLAEGGVVKGPTMALVGEDGPEVVIPVGQKRSTRGKQLLETAALMLGSEGNGPGPDVDKRGLSARAHRLGVPALAEGGVVMPGMGGGTGFPGSGAALAELYAANLRGQNSQGIFSQLGEAITRGLAWFLDKLPTPSIGNTIFDSPLNYVKQKAEDYLRDLFAHKDKWDVGDIEAGWNWAQSVMGRPYVWGGGHGGWDFNLPGYDCSGFASHAAKKSGSTIAAPGTTSSTLGIAQRGKKGPMMWGWRHMDQSDPRSQHMGAKILGTWFQFGDPGHTSGSDDGQWDITGVPPGLSSFETGVDYVPRTGVYGLHVGEAVLNRTEAADYRAGAVNQIMVNIHPAMNFLRDYIEVTVNRSAERARRKAQAGGSIR